jgi:flagellar assembly factor FliW
MQIHTTRFGFLQVDADSVIHFPAGMLGLEQCRHWVLLADAHNDAVGWLQSTSRPEVALAVVYPRRFVPQYQVRVSQSELVPLKLEEVRQAEVLVILSSNGQAMTLNLKAPLVINVERRLGRQVICNGDQPVQFGLEMERTPLRKSA